MAEVTGLGRDRSCLYWARLLYVIMAVSFMIPVAIWA